MSDPATIIENRESIELLKAAGLGRLLEALEDQRVYRRNGRLNVSALSRLLKISAERAAELLSAAKAILG